MANTQMEPIFGTTTSEAGILVTYDKQLLLVAIPTEWLLLMQTQSMLTQKEMQCEHQLRWFLAQPGTYHSGSH